jgi:hypothetical protein
MANRTNETKPRIPLTRLQKGKRYALLTLILTGGYSTYANVRSGAFNAEPIVTSVAPTFVFFLTVHLLSYFNPKDRIQRVLVYGGLGLVTLVAFGISGFHIWELTVRNGQHWIVALFYPFIVDVPSAIATAILIQKVSTNGNRPNQAKPTEPAIPVQTQPSRPKATKSTTPAKPRASRAKVPVTTKPQQDLITAN